ncbi:MAG: hypothetical protein GC154_15150 [bacterium]|nr:hypothetical protein [bacterium]
MNEQVTIPSRRRRFARWLILTLAGIVALLTLAFAMLQAPPAKRALASWLSDRLSESARARVSIKGLSGFIPFDLRVGEVTLSDSEGEWLMVRGVHFTLGAAPLLRGAVDVGELTVASIEVTRKPARANESEAKPPSERWPSLRLPSEAPRVSIRRFSLDKLHIAEAVAGRELTCSASGEFRTHAGPSLLQSRFSVRESGAERPLIQAEASIAGASPRLKIDSEIHLDEDSGLMALLGLKDVRSIESVLKGEGPLHEWHGRWELVAPPLGIVQASLTLGLDDAPHCAFEGTLSPDMEGAARDWPSWLAEGGSFSLALASPDPQTIRVNDFHLNARGAELAAGGVYALSSHVIDATLNGRLDDLSALQPWVNQPLSGAASVTVSASGPAQTPSMAASLSASGVVAASAGVRLMDVTARVRPSDSIFSAFSSWPSAQIEASADVCGVTVANGVRRIPDLAFSFSGESNRADGVHIDALTVRAASDALRLSGVADPRVESVSLSLDGRVNDVSILSPSPASSLGGVLSVTGNLVSSSWSQSLSSRLRAEANGLRNAPAPLDRLAGRRVEAGAELNLLNGTTLRVAELHASSATVSASASGAVELASQSVDVQWRADLRSLAPLSGAAGRALAGSMIASGSAFGPLDDLRASMTAASLDARVDGQPLGELTAEVNVTGVTEPKGEWRARLSRGEMTLNASSRFGLYDRRIELTDLRASAPGAQLNGSLSAEPASKRITGQLALESSDLSPLGELLREPLSGSCSIVLDASSTDLIRSRFDASVTNLNSRFGEVEKFTARGRADGVWPRLSLDAQVEAAGARYHDVAISDLIVNASGGDTLQWKTSVSGEAKRSFSVHSRGSYSHGGESHLSLDVLRADYDGAEFELRHPARISFSGDGFEIDAIDARAGSGEITLSGGVGSRSVSMIASATRAPLAWARLVGVDDVTGAIDASLRLSGDPLLPRFDLTVRGERIRLARPAFNNVRDASLDLHARYASRVLAASARIADVLPQPVTAEARIPLELSLQPFRFHLPDDESLSGSLQGRLNASVLPALLLLEGQRMEGVINADLALDGTLAQPAIAGRVEMVSGAYDHLDYGVVLRDVNLLAEAAPGEGVLKLRRLRMTDGAVGSISGSGEAPLSLQKPLSLVLALHQAQLIRQDDLTATVSGDLALKGKASSLVLSGSLEASPIEIRIPDRLPESIEQLNVVDSTRAASLTPSASSSSAAPVTAELDLKVKIPGRMFVRGRGLDSEWSGSLDVTGSTQRPRVNGSLSVVRGFFNFFSNRMALNQGTVQFSGDPANPYLTVAAQTTRKGDEFTLNLSGPASSPRMNLQSNPPLPSDEALSRLLFGRRLTDITPLQAVQLAQAANTLRGGSGAFDVMGEMRSLLGVDQIELRAGEGGDMSKTTVGLGKYLTDDVYVDLEQGFGKDSSRVKVEIELTPTISVESQLGLDKNTGVGVFWKYDF